MEKFVTFVLNSQINLFNRNDPDFNLWDDEHVAQGFSWRPGHCSFGIPDQEDDALICVGTDSDFVLVPDSFERIVQVPFEINESGVSIGTVYDDFPLEIENGLYQITFAVSKDYKYGDQRYTHALFFVFEKSQNPAFEIIKQGIEMKAKRVLKKSATLANI